MQRPIWRVAGLHLRCCGGRLDSEERSRSRHARQHIRPMSDSLPRGRIVLVRRGSRGCDPSPPGWGIDREFLGSKFLILE